MPSPSITSSSSSTSLVPVLVPVLVKATSRPVFLVLSLAFSLVVPLVSRACPISAAEEWEAILRDSIKSPYSETRHNGLKQVDANTVKGLKALWKVLASIKKR